MSRSARMLRSEKPTVYHVISRTTLPGLPLSDADKDQLVHLLQKFAAMFFVDVLGYCMIAMQEKWGQLIIDAATGIR